MRKCISIFATGVMIVTCFYPALAKADEANSETMGSGADASASSVLVNAPENYTVVSGTAPTVSTVSDNGTQKSALSVSEDTMLSWTFDVPQSGNYTLSFRYMPLEGSGNDIEMDYAVGNDDHLDSAMESATLTRIWENETETQTDSEGNQLRPSQTEASVVNRYTVRDDLESADKTLSLSQGQNTLLLQVTRENVALIEIEFSLAADAPSYADYSQLYADKSSAAGTVTIEGESAAYKSSSSLYPISDRTSPSTSPSSASVILLNTIGGENWCYDQQWIEWQFIVEETGLYQLSMRVKQNTRAGQSSFRKVYIDGEVPFSELNSVSIPYSSEWQMVTLGNSDGAYGIYLEKGTHTIRMENTIGDIGPVVSEATDLVQVLNAVYREVLVYVGSDPDPDRDYQLDELIPDLVPTLESLSDNIETIKTQLLGVMGSAGEDYAAFEDVQTQLRLFINEPDKMADQFSLFLSNIQMLAEWLLTVQEQPLTIDYTQFDTVGTTVTGAESNWLSRLWYRIEEFMASFIMDYDSIGSGEGTQQETLTVWVGTGVVSGQTQLTATGRDQAQALKAIIQNDFSAKYGVSVNLKLVDTNSIIPAVATGNGPDVALYMTSKSVMDYGFRGALYDLTGFPDYEDATQEYFAQAVAPFTYEGSAYALPDTYTCSLMFYRKDILEEIGVEVPETWDDMLTILPELNNNNLTLGLTSLSADSVEVYTTLLYQMGGQVYDDSGTKTLLATDEGVEAFEMWGDFYTKYSVPQTLDLLTYFRTGQAPVIIAPYTFYNSLAIGAPEIAGLWAAAMVPGIQNDDGTINRTVMGTSTGSVIFANTSHAQAAWEFLKWFTGADAQVQFNREVESILGTAGRIATACPAALVKMPWSKEASSLILEELGYSKALPEIPGSYMLTRYLPTAMRLVVNDGLYPRDAIINYSMLIDQEIQLKRQEFHFE